MSSPAPPPAAGPGAAGDQRDDPKTVLRRAAIAARRARDAAAVDAARDAVDRAVTTLLEPLDAAVVCSYLPLPTEPLGRRTADRLVRQGVRVLVPVTRPGAPLGWADHRPGLAAAPGAGRVPDPGPPLPEELQQRALERAAVVLVPALLADRHGTRLGRGGGHYDRSFAGTALGAVPLRAVVLFDGELVEGPLPAEEHDAPVHRAVSPTGITVLGDG